MPSEHLLFNVQLDQVVTRAEIVLSSPKPNEDIRGHDFERVEAAASQLAVVNKLGIEIAIRVCSECLDRLDTPHVDYLDVSKDAVIYSDKIGKLKNAIHELLYAARTFGFSEAGIPNVPVATENHGDDIRELSRQIAEVLEVVEALEIASTETKETLKQTTGISVTLLGFVSVDIGVVRNLMFRLQDLLDTATVIAGQGLIYLLTKSRNAARNVYETVERVSNEIEGATLRTAKRLYITASKSLATGLRIVKDAVIIRSQESAREIIVNSLSALFSSLAREDPVLFWQTATFRVEGFSTSSDRLTIRWEPPMSISFPIDDELRRAIAQTPDSDFRGLLGRAITNVPLTDQHFQNAIHNDEKLRDFEWSHFTTTPGKLPEDLDFSLVHHLSGEESYSIQIFSDELDKAEDVPITEGLYHLLGPLSIDRLKQTLTAFADLMLKEIKAR